MRTNKLKSDMRKWMFSDPEFIGDPILGIWREDYKAARRTLRRETNQVQADRIFKSVMDLLGVPTDRWGNPLIKGLHIPELVLLAKVGTRIGRAGAAAKNRIGVMYNGKQHKSNGLKDFDRTLNNSF